jgi:enoyl-CoA hydratase/carnithine racemase
VTETLALDWPQAGTVVLRLNRPKQLNAINEVMRNELTDTLAAIATDTSVNVVVITGRAGALALDPAGDSRHARTRARLGTQRDVRRRRSA